MQIKNKRKSLISNFPRRRRKKRLDMAMQILFLPLSPKGHFWVHNCRGEKRRKKAYTLIRNGIRKKRG